MRGSSLLSTESFQAKRKMTIIDEPTNETEGAPEVAAVGSSWAQRFAKKHKPAAPKRAPAPALAKPNAPAALHLASSATDFPCKASPTGDAEHALELPLVGERDGSLPAQRPLERIKALASLIEGVVIIDLGLDLYQGVADQSAPPLEQIGE